MPKAETFHVRINGGGEQTVTVKTGIYMHAAAAALALLGCDEVPASVEIWVPRLLPDYGPLRYIARHDECGRLVMAFALPLSAN